MSRKAGFISKFLILSALVILNLNSCSDECEVCPELSATHEITIPAAEHGEFCATYYTGGDYDFDGNGPNVYLKAGVYVSGDSLMFYFDVDAIETESNWTRGNGRWDRILYVAPAGYRISAVDTPVVCEDSYTDINYEMDYIEGCEDFTFRGYGDYEGDDVGFGCVRTMYWVRIRDIKVVITRE